VRARVCVCVFVCVCVYVCVTAALRMIFWISEHRGVRIGLVTAAFKIMRFRYVKSVSCTGLFTI